MHAHFFCTTMLQLVQLFARTSQRASLTARLRTHITEDEDDMIAESRKAIVAEEEAEE